MKKFMKGCGIVALVMIGIGLIMAVVVSFTKGTAYMNSFLDRVTDGRVSSWFGALEERGFDVKDGYIEGYNDFEGYDIDEASMFSEKHTIQNGNVEYTFEGMDVTNLNVELGGSMFYVEESSDNTFYVEGVNTSKFQAYQEGGTIYIKSTRKANIWDDIKKCQVTLYVPESYSFSDVQIALGAGQMDLGDLYAQSMTLEAGAGQITADFLQAQSLGISVGAGEVVVDDMDITNLDVSVGAGHFSASGKLGGEVNAECSMGGIELDLDAAEEDYDYSVECTAGTVTIGDGTYSGFAWEKTWSNGAGRLMNLECAMGEITVTFWE